MNFVLSLITVAIVLSSIHSSTQVNNEAKETRKKRGYGHQSYSPKDYPASEDNSLHGLNCKTPKSCLDPNTLPQNVDSSWMGTPRQYFVGLGTCYGYSLAAKILLGRPVRTNEELSEMCPTMFLRGADDYYSGYGKQFAQTCAGHSQNKQRDCVTLQSGTDVDVDTSPMFLDSPTVVDTDGRSWTLFYRCVNKVHGDFLVLATRPYIDEIDFVRILDKLETLGFSRNDVFIRPCADALSRLSCPHLRSSGKK